jgi:hypothetical protein
VRVKIVFIERGARRKRKPSPASNFKAKVDRDMKTVNLNWDLPTSRVDGSALKAEDIASSQVFASADGGANFGLVATVAAPDNALVLPDLVDGTYIFRVVIVDKQSTPKASVATDKTVVVATELAAPAAVAEIRVSLI